MHTLSSHMNSESHYLNLWLNSSFMWEEEVCIYGTPRVSNNFSKLTYRGDNSSCRVIIVLY